MKKPKAVCFFIVIIITFITQLYFFLLLLSGIIVFECDKMLKHSGIMHLKTSCISHKLILSIIVWMVRIKATLLGDRCPISLLILSKFKRINNFPETRKPKNFNVLLYVWLFNVTIPDHHVWILEYIWLKQKHV